MAACAELRQHRAVDALRTGNVGVHDFRDVIRRERFGRTQREVAGVVDDEVERLGETFMLLEQKMDELREHFELEKEDLNIDLGPLGKLI